MRPYAGLNTFVTRDHAMGGLIMARRRMFAGHWIASVVTVLGLVAGPWGLTLSWAAWQDQRGPSSADQRQAVERPAPVRSQTGTPVLPERSPQTLDEYAAYVQNRLQVARMELKERGTAELRITIDKNGMIRQTEILELDGPAALGRQLKPMVSQIAPLPPLPGGVDFLIVNSVLAFDYPGTDLYDRFGRLSEFPG